jgi:outer membrane protein assembly factor BamB
MVGSILLVGGFDNYLHAVDAGTGQERWRFEAQNWVWAAPFVDGGRAYVGDFDGVVHAIDVSDGREVWSKDLSDEPIVGSPVVARGVLVVAAQNGSVYGLDPSTQNPRWEPVQVHTSLDADLVADGTTVFLAPSGCVTPPGQDAKLYYMKLDVQSGALNGVREVC